MIRKKLTRKQLVEHLQRCYELTPAPDKSSQVVPILPISPVRLTQDQALQEMARYFEEFPR